MPDESDKFARSFGNALKRFLEENGISVTDAASKLGMNKQTLSTYWTDNPQGKRPMARAELLFLACTELGFVFRFGGSTVSAISRKLVRTKRAADNDDQLRLPFAREFSLADEKGSVSISVKRPARGIRVAVRVKAAS